MNLDDHSKEQLWQLLLEIAHASVMYPTHKAYTREKVLPEKPEVTAEELAQLLNMPLGEALVILEELADEQKVST
jgi:transcription initiation factor IIE alpha subunit